MADSNGGAGAARSDSATHKMFRANMLHHELVAGVEAWLSSDDIYLEEFADEDGHLAMRIRLRRFAHNLWAGIASDAIHNARVGLDHLAGSLVEDGGGNVGRSTFFPIVDKVQDFDKRAAVGLKGASPAAIKAVKKLEPWKGGGFHLWLLGELDNRDKHHMLRPVLAGNFGLRMSVPTDDEDPASGGVSFDLIHGGQPLRLRDGVVLSRSEEVPGPETPRRVGVGPLKPVVDVLFGEPDLVGEQHLTDVVGLLARHAHFALNSVLEELFSPDDGTLLAAGYANHLPPSVLSLSPRIPAARPPS